MIGVAAVYPDRAPWRLGPRGRRRFDVALAGGLLLPVLGFPLAGYPWFWTPLTVAQIGPLFWRRSHPLAVFAVVAVAHAVQVVVYDHALWGQVALPVALYSVARYSTPVRGAGALAVALVGAVLATVRWLEGYGDSGSSTGLLAYLVPLTTIVVTAWALGTLGRIRRAYVDTLVDRAERIEREAAQQVELAARDERARIAREMHDVVAHGLSVIVVQADGARYAATKEPQRATEALATIAETGREALTEMRQLLGLLRSEDGPALAPQPGLADVDALVEEARTTGMPVELRRDPQLPRVPDSVGLTVYRIVQESLTNVRKHAGPAASAEVVLGWDGGSLQVEVADDGRGAATRPDGRGLGLAGIRERVAVHGGTVDAGPRPGGGFAVSARIPV